MDDAAVRYPIASIYNDHDVDPAFDLDPYTPLLKLAEEAEVVAGRCGVFEGVAVPNFSAFPDTDRDVFLTLSFRAWREVVSNSEAFSNEKAFQASITNTLGKTLLGMDPPEHTLYKRMVLPSFGHRIVNEELAKIAAPIINDCLDQIADKGRGELISSFTSIYPYLVIAKVFGVPAELADETKALTNQAVDLGTSKDPAVIKRTFEEVDAFYKTVVAHHRARPCDDLTSALIETEVDGRPLTDDEVVAFMKVIVGAGLDTTVRQTATLIRLLLENPDQFADLRAHPELLEGAIWESLRVETAVSASPRMAVRDAEVCGVKIPAGSGVYALMGIANHDGARWEDPAKFDIRRKRQPIASFGAGIHTCLGANLSVSEMTIAMIGVLARLKNLRKDPEHWSDCRMRGWRLRSPTILPVLWDV